MCKPENEEGCSDTNNWGDPSSPFPVMLPSIYMASDIIEIFRQSKPGQNLFIPKESGVDRYRYSSNYLEQSADGDFNVNLEAVIASEIERRRYEQFGDLKFIVLKPIFPRN